MPIHVELDIYSGRQNPSWMLEQQQEDDLRKLVARAGHESNAPAVAGRLGYRGFRVIDPMPSDDGPSALFESKRDDGSAGPELVVSGSPEIEEFLRKTGMPHIDQDLNELVLDGIGRDLSIKADDSLEAAAACPRCVAADAPAYQPGLWNVPNIQPYNNCYNYANNQATNTFAQPGRATGRPITSLTCGGVLPSAQSDGLRSWGNFSTQLAAGKGWYVALVIWPGHDYHWYRQDNVGCWSHKPGQTAVRNVDNAGNRISDPRTCNRGPYTNFCTYMITTRNVRIR